MVHPNTDSLPSGYSGGLAVSGLFTCCVKRRKHLIRKLHGNLRGEGATTIPVLAFCAARKALEVRASVRRCPDWGPKRALDGRAAGPNGSPVRSAAERKRA